MGMAMMESVSRMRRKSTKNKDMEGKHTFFFGPSGRITSRLSRCGGSQVRRTGPGSWGWAGIQVVHWT